MPQRFTPLVNEEYYHIFNRGVASQPTYLAKRDYEKFTQCISYYRFNNLPCRLSKLLMLPKDEREQILKGLEKREDKVVEINAFCLMPNHFHLLIKQVRDGGISKFMRQLSDSYTRYFNIKYERVGPVFQGAFKAVHVGTDEQLIHLSRYIHLNPLTSFVVKEKYFTDYPWSSLKNYLSRNSNVINTKTILAQFKSVKEYLEFIMDQADYSKELKKIKHLALE